MADESDLICVAEIHATMLSNIHTLLGPDLGLLDM
jgi:hypothetical protein